MLELAVENYRRFLRSNEIAFPHGLTIVTGPNGAGKTTLCEAISYAIFGSRTGPGAVRSDNATGPVKVSCTFKVGGQTIRVQRSGTTANLTVDGVCLIPAQTGSMDAVTRRLQTFLGGLTREQFEQIYMAEQGQTAGLLAKTDAIRKTLLRKALDMDVLDAAYRLQDQECDQQRGDVRAKGTEVAEKAGLPVAERSRLESLARAHTEGSRRQHLGLFLGAARTAVKELESSAQKTCEAVAEAETRREVIRKSLDLAKQEDDEARKALDEWKRCRIQHKALKLRIDEAVCQAKEAAEKVKARERKVADAQACAGAAAKLSIAQDSLARLETSENRLTLAAERWSVVTDAVREMIRTRMELANLGDPFTDRIVAEQCVKQAEEECRKLETDPSAAAKIDAANRRGRLQQQEHDHRTALETIGVGAGDAPCPTCNHPLDAHARAERIFHLQTWLETQLPTCLHELDQEDKVLTQRQQAWKSARKQADRQLRQAQQDVEDAQRQIDELKRYREQSIKAQEQVRIARNRWRECSDLALWGQEYELREIRSAVARRVIALQKRAAGYADLPRLEQEAADAQQEADNHWATITRLKAQQAALAYDVAAHWHARKLLSATHKELEGLDKTWRDAERGLWEAESAAQQAKKCAANAKPALADFESMSSDYLRQERLLTLLKEFNELYYKRNMAAIEERAGALVLHAVRDGSIQGLRLGESRLQYLDGSHTLQDASRLSGGEKALVGLCLRIAVAEQALSIAQTGRPRFLILDEVLSSLDEERLEQMQQVFHEVGQRNIFEHIIMITHLETVRQTWRGARLSVRKATGATTSTAVLLDDGSIPINEDDGDA